MGVEDEGAAEGGLSGDFAQDEVLADEGVDGLIEAELGEGACSGLDSGFFFSHEEAAL